MKDPMDFVKDLDEKRFDLLVMGLFGIMAAVIFAVVLPC